MTDAIIQFASEFPTWLGTIILAAAPVTELRLAIPIAIEVWLMNPFNALALAVIGCILPFFPLYFGLEKVRIYFEKHWPWFGRLMKNRIDHAKARLQDKYERYGMIALFLYTAIPLPLTGLWSATIAAVALKIPFKPAFIGISLGTILAGILVTILTVSAHALF